MGSMTRTKATEAMWSERVRAWRESGETAEEFARSRGFAASTLHGWSSRRAYADMPRSVATYSREYGDWPLCVAVSML
ncbi:IS66 family insertion sequence element accessory protein TnpA [Sorangium sp. So ce854]|uniref:IS66 family insertion sequence element accessory protein TnpA n=1 Tax=Sorangium sp. So ce854 TaxID=3133322 RepID=UPI003F646145